MDVKNFWSVFLVAILARISLFAVANKSTDLSRIEVDQLIERIENVAAQKNSRIKKRQIDNGAQLPLTVIPPALINGPEIATGIQLQRYFYPFIQAAIIGPFTFSCRQDNGFLVVAQQLPDGTVNVQQQNAEFTYHPNPGIWWFVRCVSFETGGSGLDITGVQKPGGDSGINPNALKSLVG